MKIGFLATVSAFALLVAGQGAAKTKPACSLLRVADVQAVFGAPVNLHRGGTVSECIVRGGDRLPVVLMMNPSGKRGFNNLLAAHGPPFKTIKLGTQAVTYDRYTDSPPLVQRGVIVRKDTFVLQLSVSDVGMSPPGLPTVAQLVRLARAAVARL
jgi:hypothetical protein